MADTKTYQVRAGLQLCEVEAQVHLPTAEERLAGMDRPTLLGRFTGTPPAGLVKGSRVTLSGPGLEAVVVLDEPPAFHNAGEPFAGQSFLFEGQVYW